MEISIFLAKVIGVYLIVIGLLVLMIQKDFIVVISQIKEKADFIIFGFIITLLGLLMLVSHNLWNNAHQVVISIIGWVVFIKGLIILFFPRKFFDDLIVLVNKPIFYNLGGIISILIGLWLTYFGFVQ